MLRFAALPVAIATLLSGLAAQSNTVPGLDGRLEILDNITAWGRRGPAYPGGEVNVSASGSPPAAVTVS